MQDGPHPSGSGAAATLKLCSETVQADLAAVLVDTETYFKAAKQAILSAKKQVVLMGWDIHGGTVIDPGADGPETLRDTIQAAVDANPELRVYLLQWDWAVLYAEEREPFPRINLDLRLPKSVTLAMDNRVPVGASQHQKVLVVDDQVAFCGGIDIAIRRWDTRAHKADEPRRTDPGGKTYDPFHDMQMMVTGEAARVFGRIVRDRWTLATGDDLAAPDVDGPPDVPDYEPALSIENIPLGISRTLPAFEDSDEVCNGIETLKAIINSAERFIYIENQFVSSDAVAQALVDRMLEAPDLEVIIVCPAAHGGWLETRTMGAGRARWQKRMRDAGVYDRVRMAHPVVPGENGEDVGVFVHAKMIAADDKVLRIGSSNLNNRSQGFDCECDIIVTGDTEERRAFIARVRNDLLAEHMDCTPDDIAEALEHERPVEVFDRLGEGPRGLRRIEEPEDNLTMADELLTSVADPERPVSLEEMSAWMGSAETQSKQSKQKSLWRALIPAVLMLFGFAALAAVWKFTPLSEWADIDRVTAFLKSVRSYDWAIPITLAIFIVGGLAFFPVTLLIVATGLTFGPVVGAAVSLTGAVLSAVVGYLAGLAMGRPLLKKLMGDSIDRTAAAIRRQGIVATAAIRLIPVAPFSAINFAAGASQIGLRVFAVGTLFGMAPAVIALSVFGGTVPDLTGENAWQNIGWLWLAVLIWIGLLVAAHRYLGKRNKRS